MVETKEERERLKTIVALLVAFAAILGAIFTWRSLVASGAATGSDAKGINATLNAQQNKSLTNSTLSQHLEGYIYYSTNRQISQRIGEDAFDKFIWQRGAYGPITDTVAQAQVDSLANELDRLTADAADRAGVSQYFFVTDYLEPDGTYNADRELGEAQAEGSRYTDVDPAPHFARADRQRAKSQALVGVLFVLALSVWLTVMSQLIPRRWRSTSLLAALCVLLLGGTIGLLVEVLA